MSDSQATWCAIGAEVLLSAGLGVGTALAARMAGPAASASGAARGRGWWRMPQLPETANKGPISAVHVSVQDEVSAFFRSVPRAELGKDQWTLFAAMGRQLEGKFGMGMFAGAEGETLAARFAEEFAGQAAFWRTRNAALPPASPSLAQAGTLDVAPQQVARQVQLARPPAEEAIVTRWLESLSAGAPLPQELQWRWPSASNDWISDFNLPDLPFPPHSGQHGQGLWAQSLIQGGHLGGIGHLPNGIGRPVAAASPKGGGEPPGGAEGTAAEPAKPTTSATSPDIGEIVGQEHVRAEAAKIPDASELRRQDGMRLQQAIRRLPFDVQALPPSQAFSMLPTLVERANAVKGRTSAQEILDLLDSAARQIISGDAGLGQGQQDELFNRIREALYIAASPEYFSPAQINNLADEAVRQVLAQPSPHLVSRLSLMRHDDMIGMIAVYHAEAFHQMAPALATGPQLNAAYRAIENALFRELGGRMPDLPARWIDDNKLGRYVDKQIATVLADSEVMADFWSTSGDLDVSDISAKLVAHILGIQPGGPLLDRIEGVIKTRAALIIRGEHPLQKPFLKDMGEITLHGPAKPLSDDDVIALVDQEIIGALDEGGDAGTLLLNTDDMADFERAVYIRLVIIPEIERFLGKDWQAGPRADRLLGILNMRLNALVDLTDEKLVDAFSRNTMHTAPANASYGDDLFSAADLIDATKAGQIIDAALAEFETWASDSLVTRIRNGCDLPGDQLDLADEIRGHDSLIQSGMLAEPNDLMSQELINEKIGAFLERKRAEAAALQAGRNPSGFEASVARIGRQMWSWYHSTEEAATSPTSGIELIDEAFDRTGIGYERLEDEVDLPEQALQLSQDDFASRFSRFFAGLRARPDTNKE